MASTYLARQPIIASDESLFAYEILYRDNHKLTSFSNDRYASAAVITAVLNLFGTKKLLGDHKAFVKVDRSFLLSDLIFSIPKDFFIFSLLNSVEVDERVVERVEQLKQKGYVLSISDMLLNKENLRKYIDIFEFVSYIKFDINENEHYEVQKALQIIKNFDIEIIGTKIESPEAFDLAQSLGCDYFQGYFFAKPKIVEGQRCDAAKLEVIKLSNMLMSEVNIDEITHEFEQNHTITVQLLQFINSGAFHFRNRISSVHHILTLVGRQPLAQWLLLLVYSKYVTNVVHYTPLMLLVKGRTQMMQGIYKALKPDATERMLGEAYFVGVLSLMDTVLSMPIEEVLNTMNISDEVKKAILNDEGLLGEIFALVRHIEYFDTDAIGKFIDRHPLENENLKQTILQSIEHVNLFTAS